MGGVCSKVLKLFEHESKDWINDMQNIIQIAFELRFSKKLLKHGNTRLFSVTDFQINGLLHKYKGICTYENNYFDRVVSVE